MILYGKGNTNLVISAPHAGNIKPENIPSRKYGTKLKDSYTDRILTGFIRQCEECPYYLMAEIHRSRVDLNRDLKEGAQGNPQAIEIWKQWHFLLNYYLEQATLKSKALYIDLHSHNDCDEFQIGYDLDAKEYLAVQKDPLHPMYQKMFGEFSIKSLLEQRGYKVFSPQTNSTYFNGGYSVEKYRKKPKVVAIQVEVPVSIAKDKRVPIDLYEAIIIFKNKYV